MKLNAGGGDPPDITGMYPDNVLANRRGDPLLKKPLLGGEINTE